MSFLLPTAITSRLGAGFGGTESSDKGKSSSPITAEARTSSVKESEPLARPAALAWLALYRILQLPHRQSSLDNAKSQGEGDAVGTAEQDESKAQEHADLSNEDQEEGDKSDLDILFYSSKELAVTRAQIRRQIGLLRGAADFCGSMLPEATILGSAKHSTTDKEVVYTVHSQHHRNVVIQLEEDIWLAASIEVPRWTRSTVPKVRYAYDEEWRPDSWIVESLKSAWDTWSMLNGKASKQLGDGGAGRQRLERSLERYFSVWASRWDVAGRTALTATKGAQATVSVASEALGGFLSVDRELRRKDESEEAAICACARESLGRKINFVKETPAQTTQSTEVLCEMMLFRAEKMILHEAAKPEFKASNRTIALLYNHIRSTFDPIFAEQAASLRDTIRQRRLHEISKESGTSRSSLQAADKASHRLSWLSLWSSADETPGESKAEPVDPDVPSSADRSRGDSAGGLQEIQKPTGSTRAFPSISITSSAWFGSAVPASPKAAQKDEAKETAGAEEVKHEVDEPDVAEDPVPYFEEIPLRGWTVGEEHEAQSAAVKVRFLVRGDILLLLVFQEEAKESISASDEDEESLRSRVWKALQPLVPTRLSPESHLRFECDVQEGTVHSKPGGSSSSSKREAKLTPSVQATTRKMLMLHESAMRANPHCVTEVMSRSNQGDAWMRSWHASENTWTHAIVPDGRLSMAAADMETSSSASPSTTSTTTSKPA